MLNFASPPTRIISRSLYTYTYALCTISCTIASAIIITHASSPGYSSTNKHFILVVGLGDFRYRYGVSVEDASVRSGLIRALFITPMNRTGDAILQLPPPSSTLGVMGHIPTSNTVMSTSTEGYLLFTKIQSQCPNPHPTLWL